MFIYWFLFLLIAISSFEGFGLRKKSTLYPLLVIFIIIFAGCRGNGFDWLPYQEIYTLYQKGGERSGESFIEYGFQLLCIISPFYKFLIFITAVVSIGFTLNNTYYFSKKYFPVLGLLIFITTLLLPTYMGQIRQGLAMGFVCRAIWCNYIGKKRNAAIWIIIACFFHVSAALCCLIFFVPKKNFSIKFYVLTLVIAFAFNNLFKTLLTSIMQFSQFGVIQKLLVYSAGNYELGFSFTIIIRIATLLLVLYINRDNNKKISYLCNIYYYGILIYLIFGFLPMLGGRGSIYFSIYEIVLVPYIVYKLRKNKVLCLYAFMAIISISFLRYYQFFSDEFYQFSYIPYLLY